MTLLSCGSAIIVLVCGWLVLAGRAWVTDPFNIWVVVDSPTPLSCRGKAIIEIDFQAGMDGSLVDSARGVLALSAIDTALVVVFDGGDDFAGASCHQVMFVSGVASKAITLNTALPMAIPTSIKKAQSR